jgi:hypothetical protein
MPAIMRSRIVSFQFAIQEHTELQFGAVVDMGVRLGLHTGADVTLEQSAERMLGLRERGGNKLHNEELQPRRHY